MTTTISEYYLDELYAWKSAIDLYIEEIDEAEEWLQTLLKFDTIPEFTGTVEHYLGQLFLSKENLLALRPRIQLHERKLYKEQTPVSNETINKEIRSQQKQLRQEAHRIEKEYLDLKYERDEFLAEAVEIQNRIKKINP